MNPYFEKLKEHFSYPKLYVRFNKEALLAFAEEIALKELGAPLWRDEVFPEDEREFVEFIGWANTVNFGSRDVRTGRSFETLWPECPYCRQKRECYGRRVKESFSCSSHDFPAKLWRGSFALAACLARAVQDGIPVTDAQFLRSQEWSKELARFVFRGSIPFSVSPMFRERHLLLKESARELQQYNDRWLNIFESASFRAFDQGRGAVERLAALASFSDIYTSFNGQEVFLPFFKRAHLLVQIYEGRASHSAVLARIKDSEELMFPADPNLSRAFRAIEAFEYSPWLTKRILAGERLKPSSRQVVEIRLATIEAGEILKARVNEIRQKQWLRPYTTVELDYYLWTMGRNCGEPPYLTRTTRH